MLDGKRKKEAMAAYAGSGATSSKAATNKGAIHENGAGRGRDVLVALRQIMRATDLHSKQVQKDSGLTIPQLIVLQTVEELGEVTTGTLSQTVHLSQATVTSILDRLEDHGLVERYRSNEDRRVVHARLTKAGRAALRRAPPMLQAKFVEAFNDLTTSQQNRIVKTLQDIAVMMGAEHLDVAPLLDIAPPRRGKD